ncbi:hypothetical protein ACFDR9_001508 [Janthinobacterium sp. CG_23.3]|uniref:hypothetical protein n=1 Tax=Janthinobacterium sp. CG_23.3 TaxID=3349634 RepID=UPI0038D35DE1
MAEQGKLGVSRVKRTGAKTFGLIGVLHGTLAPLSKQIRIAFVYGATAKGQDAAGSNIDLLLIGDDTNYGDLLSSLAPGERMLRRKINPNLYSIADFKRRLREEQPFLTQVLQQPKIYGDCSAAMRQAG